MVDVSKLVISVDSDGVRTATGDLELLNKAGTKSEKTTDSLDQSVKKLTKQFERQARNAGKSANEIKILDLKAKGATTAQLKAAQAAMKNAEAMKKQADAARFASMSAGETNGAFRAMRGSTQQLSWQLQDVAVQAQMGTSAFMILGQQGPQIASIFGSGGAVAGAVIAFGSILAGTLYHALTGTSEALGDLEDDVSNLIDEFDDLTGAMRELALLQAAKEQDELAKAIKNGHDEIKRLGEVYEAQGQQIEHTEQSTKNYSDAVLKQNAIIQKAGIRYREITRAVDGVTNAHEDLVQKLIDERKEIGANSVVLAYQEAVRAGANDEQLRGIVLLAAQNLAAKEASEETEENNKAIEKAKEQQQKYNANLQHQLNLLTLTGPALDAYKASVKGGTKEQQEANAELERQIRLKKEAIALDKKIADNEDKLTDFFRKANAKKDADAEKAEQDAQKRAAKAAQRGLDKITLLALQHEAERIQLADDLANELITQQAHDEALKGQARETAAALAEIDKKSAEDKQAITDAKLKIDQQVLASAAGIIGQLAGVAEEGSREARILFAMQKALAIAQIIVATEVAAQAAAAQAALLGGPVAWYATQGMIRAMGYASAGIVAGTAIAGGRALGGQVRGGESYLVGERGPELLTMGTSGRIATNENLKNAVGSDNNNTSNVVNVNFSVQANDTAGFDRLLQSRRGQIVGMINQAVNNRGRASIV